MQSLTLEQHIVSTPDVLGGKPRIAGRRISVYNIVVWHDIMGQSVDEIVSDYDLTPGQVYAALSYYWDNKATIDKIEAEDEEFFANLREKNPSRLREMLDGQQG